MKRALIVGAGPAGLYLACLLRRQQPALELHVVERNPPDATFGFGVVFSDRALEFLRADDPSTCDAIGAATERWRDLALVHRGQRIVIDGVGFAAVGRLRLLQLLRERLSTVGVQPQYGCTVDAAESFDGWDLVVGADGANSVVRRGHEAAFGTRVELLDNRFAWFGTPRRFETLTQTFVERDGGHFNAHHYRYAPDASTFIVECSAETWERAGFATMDEQASRVACERIFAEIPAVGRLEVTIRKYATGVPGAAPPRRSRAATPDGPARSCHPAGRSTAAAMDRRASAVPRHRPTAAVRVRRRRRSGRWS